MQIDGASGGQQRTIARVLLADPDDEHRNRLASTLASSGCEVTCAVTGEEALRAATELQPGVVVLEVSLPGTCAYEVCRRLREQRGNDVVIVFVSGTRTESFDRVAGILIGADDYMIKPLAVDEFLARTSRLISRRPTQATTPVSRPSWELTRRERDVLGLLAQGLSQREIAERLVISHKTVGTHTEHIFTKMGVRTRSQAASLAHRHLSDLTASAGGGDLSRATIR
jgi:DNA-binding NarL/FixJ family response regulator